MKARETAVTSILVILLTVSWLGFAVHRSPRFAGTLVGGLLAVSGSLLMLVPLAYLIIKRLPAVKRVVTKRVSMPTLLTIHIYAGLVGPILVVLHTGHRFESPLGIALTAMTLVVTVSGYIGRSLVARIARDEAEERRLLAGLEGSYRYLSTQYERAAAELSALPEQQALLQAYGRGRIVQPVARVADVAASMADVEYAIKTHELFKRLFSGWLRLHIGLSFTLYMLLGLHVWSGIHFGLRWFR